MDQGGSDSNRKGGTEREMRQISWRPSLGFRIGLAGLALTVTVLVAAGLAGASQDASAPVPSTPTATPAREKDENRPSRPRDSFAREAHGGDSEASGDASGTPRGAAATSPGAGNGSAGESGATLVGGGTPTPTVGESAVATPAAIEAEDTTELTSRASAIVAQIESLYGIVIQIDGQNWGADEEDQVRNLTSIEAALSALPPVILDETSEGAGGSLTILSNEHGRTLAGWQPYGDRAANFYTNEDLGPAGRHSANQVVLQTGSSARTIAHEILHAYQLRDTAPGSFVSALLTDEMKSFMATTGWTQLATDEVILATGGNSWDGVNKLFDYDGPALLYTNQFGGTTELYAPNPLEAFAEAAALYYTHDSEWPLPGWSAVWAWFDSNLA